MRINEPKRPTEDQVRNAEQFYKWMYQATEQLNMMMEQLERNNVLDLQAGFGSSSADGLLSGSVAENAENIEKLQEVQTQQEGQISGLQDSNSSLRDAVSGLQVQLGDYMIQTGTATIAFGPESRRVTVTFPREFAEPPSVLTSAIFEDANVVVTQESTTAKQFVAGVGFVSSTSGTRGFSWLAIGKMKEG